ncbi:hypothetical protein WJX81_007674 [Elliptochloris bilobata]|uniref:Uncharacterized protein n=1 Tax=Elliptochloris bilobata TaxID=381761 RepID=A0AAW1S561_9CHLO
MGAIIILSLGKPSKGPRAYPLQTPAFKSMGFTTCATAPRYPPLARASPANLLFDMDTDFDAAAPDDGDLPRGAYRGCALFEAAPGDDGDLPRVSSQGAAVLFGFRCYDSAVFRTDTALPSGIVPAAAELPFVPACCASVAAPAVGVCVEAIACGSAVLSFARGLLSWITNQHRHTQQQGSGALERCQYPVTRQAVHGSLVPAVPGDPRPQHEAIARLTLT